MKNLIQRAVRIATAASVVAAGTAGLVGTSHAQAYPSKPVEMIVPFAAGSSPDVVARHLSRALSDRMGQQFIVQNRAGAGGAIAADSVVRAPADGHTLFFMVNSVVTMNQFIFKKLNYDAARDFTPVTTVAEVPYVLIAHKDFPHKNLKDVLAFAKSNPNKIDYASAGVGGAGHIIMELMTSMSGVKLNHIPYGKSNPMMDVLAGQVPLIFQPTTTALSQIERGTVFGLGVTGQRLPSLPDVPAISEFVPGYNADGWQGVIVRSGTPDEIVQRLNKEIRDIISTPEMKETFSKLGITPSGSSSAELKERIAAETVKWGKVIRDAGIEAN